MQQDEVFNYDLTDNRTRYAFTQPVVVTETIQHNTANQITELDSTPGELTPTYDPVGNMTSYHIQPGEWLMWALIF